MLTKGSTAIAGRSGGGRAGRGSWDSSGGGSAAGRGDGAVRPHLHVADETESLAGDGADQLLVVAAVAERLAGGVDAAGQGGIRHDPAAPDRGDEVVLAHDAVAVLHQVDQQVEHLRLDRDRFEAPAQLPPVGIKPMIGKRNCTPSPAEPPPSQGIFKPVSRTNQAGRKVIRSRCWHPARSLIAPDAIAMDRRAP